ncbi:SRPBCC family protein [Chitinophagaceae bacterium MMS25-I14]
MQREHFSVTRKLNAPKQMVFEAFADANALAQWWGPVEAPIDVVKLDFRPGGIFHYKMKGNSNHHGIFRYIAINEPDSIEWINSFADEHAQIIKPPFPGIDFPREIHNLLTLEEADGVTTLTLSGYPVNATESEENTFYSFFSSMQQGFTGTLNQLENYLKKKQQH